MDMIRFWKGDVRVITTFASMKYGKQIFGVMLSVIAMGAWAQPQFSHPHGLYRQTTLTVGISATDSEAEIRYTIDGSVPTAQILPSSKAFFILKICDISTEATIPTILFFSSIPNLLA